MCTLFANLYVLLTRGPHMVYMGTPYIVYIYMITCGWLGRTSGRGVSYGKIGLTTMAVTHDLLSGMPLVLLRKKVIRLWNSIFPEPGQPSAQLSKLIRLTKCKKTKQTVSRWYRTVYIS